MKPILCGGDTKTTGQPCKNPVTKPGERCGQCLGKPGDASAASAKTLSNLGSQAQALDVPGDTDFDLGDEQDVNVLCDKLGQALAHWPPPKFAVGVWEDEEEDEAEEEDGEDGDFSDDPALASGFEAATKKDAAPDELAELAKSEHPVVRAAVGRRSNTPVETRTALLNDPDPRVAAATAHSHHLTKEQVALAGKHPDKNVRAAVASNNLNTEEALKGFVMGDSHRVAAAALANKYVTSAVAHCAAMSTDPKRRRILAASPAAGLLTIDESHPAAQHPVADPEPKVRLAYLKNSHPGVVKPMQVYKLCCDEVPEIARLAVTSPLLSDDNKTHLLKYHPQLAEHPDAHIRSVVAGWPGLGASRLAVLAHDDNPHVRAAALTNAGCSAETVFEGALDHNDHVRHAALRSPNLPQGAVAKAITSDDPHDRAVLASNGSVLTPDQKGVLAFDTNQYVRATLVEAYGAKDAALVQAAATDTHWRPRRSAARVSTSVTLLKTLGEDPDPRVSQTAKHNASYPAPA